MFNNHAVIFLLYLHIQQGLKIVEVQGPGLSFIFIGPVYVKAQVDLSKVKECIL